MNLDNFKKARDDGSLRVGVEVTAVGKKTHIKSGSKYKVVKVFDDHIHVLDETKEKTALKYYEFKL